MATTSSTLAAGKARIGAGSFGKGGKGRVAMLIGVTALGLTLIGGLIGYGRQIAPAAQSGQFGRSLAVTDTNTVSDYGTAFDPFVISNSQARYVPAVTPEVNTTSDLGTDFDPYIISSSQPRYQPNSFGPMPPAGTNATSDYGTDFDPFVISNSQPRYAPALDWGQAERTQVAP